MTATETGPPTIHRGEADLPFVDVGDGVQLQVLQVDLAQGIWIIRIKFAPGTSVQIHKHTGHVYASPRRARGIIWSRPRRSTSRGRSSSSPPTRCTR